MYSDQRRQPIGWIPAGALALSLLVGCKPAAAPSGAPTADAAANRWMDSAAQTYFKGGGQMQVVRIAVPDQVSYGAPQ